MAKREFGTIADNRRARHDYTILATYEAGIVLQGTEVKSLRDGGTSITEAHAGLKEDTIYLFNANIPIYKSANRFNHEPKRPRKLLLRKRELSKIVGSLQRDGTTLIALRLYFNNRGLAKIQLGLGKGKKKVDKRQDIKERDWNRRKEKIMRNS
jgi:SsrA-binding protein